MSGPSIDLSPVEQLEAMERKYREIPLEAIVKQDILRLGIHFDAKAVEGANFKQKDYFIFSFDHIPLEEQSEDAFQRLLEVKARQNQIEDGETEREERTSLPSGRVQP